MWGTNWRSSCSLFYTGLELVIFHLSLQKFRILRFCEVS
jgi:hypothetical protein